MSVCQPHSPRMKGQDAASTLMFSLAADAFDFRADSVNTCGGGDKQQLPVLAAETNIRGPTFRHIDVFDLFAALVEYAHALAGQVDVALIVDCHAVGTERAEELLVFQRSVGLNIVAISFVGPDIGNIKDFAVGRADDAIWFFQVFGDADRFFCRSAEDNKRLRCFAPPTCRSSNLFCRADRSDILRLRR